MHKGSIKRRALQSSSHDLWPLLDRVTCCQAHMENLEQASKWFNILLARVPSDPGILSRMGHIANKEDDDSQAYFYHKER